MDDLFFAAAISALWSRGGAIVFGLMGAIGLVWVIGHTMGVDRTMNEAHQRGFAEYCTTDGSRVWLGECPEDQPND